jgi:hypothetical protein
MRKGIIRVAEMTAISSVLLILALLVMNHKFPILSSAETVGIEATDFLWTYRLIDLMAQAFVLFAAAACCVAVLRNEEKKHDPT